MTVLSIADTVTQAVASQDLPPISMLAQALVSVYRGIEAATSTCRERQRDMELGDAATAVKSSRAATFVLVHGAFHGGWCWERVRRRLIGGGARVYTPSQTGLGDRRHLLSAAITMETFVADIVNLVESEELTDVVLVGHSFGMRTVLGVADRIPERLSHLVSLDGAIALDGRSRLEAMSPRERAERVAAAQDHDGGVSVPPPPATRYGLTDPHEIAWVDRRLTPQPLSVEASRLVLRHPVGNGLPGTYVRFTEPAFGNLLPSAEYARSHPHWSYLEIASNHDAIISASDQVCEVLEAVARLSPPTDIRVAAVRR